MAELEFGRNICMDYNFEDTPDPSSQTNVTMPYWHMIDTNLAMRLVPDFGKEVPASLLAQASQSLATASGISARANLRQVAPPNRQAVGEATTLRYNNYQRFNRAQELPPQNCETNTLFQGDINDYVESFRAYLDDAETISSYTIDADNGLTIISDTNNDPFINYTIQANDDGTFTKSWQQVKIIVTTSNGRVETRLVNFQVNSNRTVNNN